MRTTAKDNFRFATFNLSDTIPLPEIREGFKRVPVDPYVEDRSRMKAICRATVCGGRVLPRPHGPLYHPINAVAYGGHNSRTYAEIPEDDQANLSGVIRAFADLAKVPDGEEIMVNQQRVQVKATEAIARAVQEGWHRDGVLSVAMLCIARENVEGGISLICDNEHFVLFGGLLQPGEMLILDDTALLHNATPIRRVNPNLPAYRDVLILTVPACRQP